MRQDYMYVHGAQKFFTYAGHHLIEAGRESVRIVERWMRHMPKEKGAYRTEVIERICSVVRAVFVFPLAILLAVPSFGCYTLASCLGKGHFEYIDAGKGAPLEGRDIKVMSLNVCFQDPWSPLSGGVRAPLEPITPSHNRLTALVHKIAKKQPTVFLGQEFDNIDAQDAFIRQMQAHGYRYFLRDLGSNDPIRNHSGLFVASKVPFSDVQFVPYPAENRAGLAKWSNQGALAFTVSVGDKKIQLVNLHLNYPGKEVEDAARARQLSRHVAPLAAKKNTVFVGDMNCDTAVHKIDQMAPALKGYINAFNGQVTCTDSGKHTLRGKSRTPGGKPCTECEERVDALIYHPKKVNVIDTYLKPMRYQKKELLSDHNAMVATLC